MCWIRVDSDFQFLVDLFVSEDLELYLAYFVKCLSLSLSISVCVSDTNFMPLYLKN